MQMSPKVERRVGHTVCDASSTEMEHCTEMEKHQIANSSLERDKGIPLIRHSLVWVSGLSRETVIDNHILNCQLIQWDIKRCTIPFWDITNTPFWVSGLRRKSSNRFHVLSQQLPRQQQIWQHSESTVCDSEKRDINRHTTSRVLVQQNNNRYSIFQVIGSTVGLRTGSPLSISVAPPPWLLPLSSSLWCFRLPVPPTTFQPPALLPTPEPPPSPLPPLLV